MMSLQQIKSIFLFGFGLIAFQLSAQNLIPNSDGGFLELSNSTQQFINQETVKSGGTSCPVPGYVSNPICGSGQVVIQLSGNPAGEYNWYLSGASIPFHIGASYTTPVISNSETYYVSAVCVSDTMDLNLPPHSSVFSGNTRGYWFVAPVDFRITGLKVPTAAGTGSQYIEVVRFHQAPQNYPSTTNNFDSLVYISGVTDTNFVNVNISIFAGDTIGVLGSIDFHNSYGNSGFSSNINGHPIILQRLGFQGQLQSGPAHDLFTETVNPISRIEMRYVVEEESNLEPVVARVDQNPVNTVTVSGNDLVADAVGVLYQWLDCDNANNPISGANARTFTPSISGNYSVRLTSGVCTVVSSCVNYIVSAVENFDNSNLFRIYPNPAKDVFNIDFGKTIDEFTVTVYSVQGQIMYRKLFSGISKIQIQPEIQTGMYLLEIETAEGKKTVNKLIKD